ncbi:MAG: SUMF1/EgtB/PvdO family nonheme iron enzyme [Halieaceae bacterium]|nr:SUMF1/EgtB/PvdO family nonheme iron enzyme [Halieaceae bacterium]
MSLTPNTTILNDKYHILRLVGEGGMARVWLAKEPEFRNRQVAIKEPKIDLFPEHRRELLERYRRERDISARLKLAKAPHVVEAITAEPYENDFLLVLEYMPGGDLEILLQKHRQGLPLDQATAIARQVLLALTAVHDHPDEIVHRDIKPSNILFDARNEVHVGDFGLAQIAGAGQDLTHFLGGSVTGTPLYAAPEQEQGKGYLTPAADIYAFGCVLFEMLTGRRYKREWRPDLKAADLRSDLPPWLDELVAKALREEPWRRWRDGAEMLAALEKGQAVAKTRSEEEVAAQGRARETALAARYDELQVAFGEARWQDAILLAGRILEESPGYRDVNKLRTQAQEAQRREAETVAPAVAPAANKKAKKEKERQSIWRQIGIEMIHIPAGDFLYGNGKKKINLGDYSLAKTPVTNAQYKVFIDATGHRQPGHWTGGVIPKGKENHPVVEVSWEDAQAFCQWSGLRLPTEQEWEKGARGTDGRAYPWGNQDPNASLCNFDRNIGDTTPVNRYSGGASPYGLLDMAGNVWDWCEDWYDSNKKYRVLRGGSWRDYQNGVRSAFWGYVSPGVRNYDIGFRCALS